MSMVSVLLILLMMPTVLLFTEPRVGNAGDKRLKDDRRSSRNCRHVYSLLADTAVIAAARTQPQRRHNIPSYNITVMLLQCCSGATAARAFIVTLIQANLPKQPVTK